MPPAAWSLEAELLLAAEVPGPLEEELEAWSKGCSEEEPDDEPEDHRLAAAGARICLLPGLMMAPSCSHSPREE